MSLPKRDGVNGRYYLIHKPDTDLEVLEHADQCIQDILDTEIQLTNDDCIPLTLRKRSQIVKLFNKFLISHSASE